jgi:hypothetical protein
MATSLVFARAQATWLAVFGMHFFLWQLLCSTCSYYAVKKVVIATILPTPVVKRIGAYRGYSIPPGRAGQS